MKQLTEIRRRINRLRGRLRRPQATEAGVQLQVMPEGEKVLMDVRGDTPCCLTLSTGEALDLAQHLIAAVVEATEVAPFDPLMALQERMAQRGR